MNNLNEELKKHENANAKITGSTEDGLDDTQRVKVLSPGQLVFKRFIRNKLAIVGTCILVFMFLFSFVGPLLYGYSQTEIFYKYDYLTIDYASATEREEYVAYRANDGASIASTTINMAKANIEEMLKDNLTVYSMRNTSYRIVKLTDYIYALNDTRIGEEPLYLFSTYVFDAYSGETKITDEFKLRAMLAAAGSMHFLVGEDSFEIKKEDDALVIYKQGQDIPYALFSTFVVRRYSGEDTLAFDFKLMVASKVEEMLEAKKQSTSFTYELPQLDKTGEFIRDENGKLKNTDTEIVITMKNGQYVLNCEQVTYLIDIYGAPSSAHLFGTDSNGMDVLARMMYGGRISLMVGFVVVIIETLLGVIMGGIAGYFGGWVDTLIMRLVDVFYCIPSLPVMIILGAMFDTMKMNPYVRLMWLMAVLGFLGWASVARLVRGQILSLREQDFMLATEATGLSTRARIFKHLIPNVMPQLIVTATAGLGIVILTESTLSFLGIGVKHPLATWGTMINSVSDYASMINYVYIWLPVGILICLTVIAFNFVGDGLRDAFDPKMKR